jgi:hypothetical protein
MRRFGLRVPGNERLIVAVLALLATYIFFYEYLPPFHKVHIFSDIEGYHFPLQRYAFDSLKQGRFPQWDPSIYCGITFAGNVQAALLYPPTWLLYGASWGFRHLPFRALECFAFAHVWLGFVLCYGWLRGRRLGKIPCALGAGVFAYGGYMISQIVHLGVVTGLAWMPLGLWGIDEAIDRRDWRPLWKTALASAMSFLAGYPASWLVFCATTFLYALAGRGRWRAAAGVCAAVAASVLLAMAQALPVLEARRFMLPGEKYGGGANHWSFLIPFFVPNWFDFNLYSKAPYPDAMYLYFGLSTIFAIAWALRRFRLRPYIQALVPALFCLILGTNVNFWPYRAIVKIPFLERVLQSYNFYEGVAAMAALITAIGLDDFLERGPRKTPPQWMTAGAAIALAVWSIRQIRHWPHGGNFPAGNGALAETAIAVVLFSAVLFLCRAQAGARRAWLAAVLLLAAGIDYKVFGTNRRFNTADGSGSEADGPNGINGMNGVAYRTLWNNRDYRIACDEEASPYATDLRRWGLATPQGFDPFLPAQYHALIERWVKFQTNRVFLPDVRNDEMLRALGIRYVITHEGTANDPYLSASPKFRLVGRDDSFYRVYEYQNANAPFGWEDGSGDVRPTEWQPERRVFVARSDRGGRFDLAEQFYPGWHATVDGRPAAIERWNGAFQAIHAGAGQHTIVFAYREHYLLLGAAISLLAWGGLAAVMVSDRRKREPARIRWVLLELDVQFAIQGRVRHPESR